MRPSLRALTVGAILAGTFFAGPAPAIAGPVFFGGPIPLDKVGGEALPAVACPSTTECTAVSAHGRVVTFDPGSSATPTPLLFDSGSALTDVACSSTDNCTAVDDSGREVSFDPQHGGRLPTTDVNDAGRPLSGVACPSAGQCTAVDSDGHEVTFVPGAAGVTTPVTINNGIPLLAIACPLATQCTAVGQGGWEVTFNPQHPAFPSITIRVTVDSGHFLDGVACPSATECTAVDDAGQEVTFDPQSPGTPTPVTVDTGHALGGVACPSATRCAAVGQGGREVTFNPQSPGNPTPATVDGANPLYGVACPSATQCTAVDGDGLRVTFDPGSPGTTTPMTVASGAALRSIACASPTQCTAVDDGGREVTFNPQSGSPTPVVVDSGGSLTGVACPSTSQCTAVDDGGREVTFDPLNPGTPTPVSVDGGNLLVGVACPSTTQCTAADSSGDVVTFNPQSPARPAPVSVTVDSSSVITGIACASVTVCTVVDADGREVSFFAESPFFTPTPITVDAGHTLEAVACPSATQCVAVDFGGGEVTFNPQSPESPTRAVVDSGHPLTGVACASPSQCTAVGLTTAREVAFDPQSPGGAIPGPIPFATFVTDVACPSTTECVAIDEVGDGFVGTRDLTAPTPTLTSPSAGAVTRDSSPAFAGVAGTAPGDDPAVTVKIWSGQTADAGNADYTLTVSGDPGTGAYSSSGPFLRSSDSQSVATLPDGTYTAQAFQSDFSSNTGQSTATPTFTIDTHAPTTTDDVPTAYVDHDVTVALSATDTGGVGVDKTYYTTGASPADPTTSSSIYDAASKPVLHDGEKIKYFSTDQAGNAEAVRTSPAARVDTAVPSSSASAAATSGSTHVQVDYGASDGGGSGLDKVELYVRAPGDSSYSKATTDSAPQASGAHFDYTAASGDGDYAFYTRAYDKAGNAESAPPGPDATTTVDTHAPTTSDDVPTAYVDHDVTVTLSATDTGGVGVDTTYYTTGASRADPTTSSSVYDPASKPVLHDGEKIKYFSTDQAGNAEAVRTSPAARVDTAVPSSSASAPATSGSTQIQVGYGAADGGGSGLDKVELYVKAPGDSSYSKAATDSAPQASGAHFDYAAASGDGDYAFYTRAYDKAGNAESPPPGPDATTAIDTHAPTPIVTPDPDTSPPVVSGLKLTPRSFRRAHGSTVSYTLSEAATVTFSVQRATEGRRGPHGCTTTTRRNRRQRPCILYRTLRGSIEPQDAPGSHTFRFDGVIGGKRLTPGSYRLRALPVDAAQNTGNPAYARFDVLSDRHRAPGTG